MTIHRAPISPERKPSRRAGPRPVSTPSASVTARRQDDEERGLLGDDRRASLGESAGEAGPWSRFAWRWAACHRGPAREEPLAGRLSRRLGSGVTRGTGHRLLPFWRGW